MNDQQLNMLSSPPPQDELRRRRLPDGQELTYVEARYIAEKLNAIFGPDGWSREFCGRGLQVTDHVERLDDGKLEYYADASCDYRVSVAGRVFEDVGFAQSDKHSNAGQAIEQASKTAVTDAFKRCVRMIGNALGSCLYDQSWRATHSNAAGGDKKLKPGERWQVLEDLIETAGKGK